MNWNYHKIIEGILRHDIIYVKKFYHKYKKTIKRELKEENNLDQKVYSIVGCTILEITDDCEVESLISKNIERMNVGELDIMNFECIEEVQKYILRKWLLEDNNAKFSWVFNCTSMNMKVNGACSYFHSIAIKNDLIIINKYTRLFEVFYSSDYKLPYRANINNIEHITGDGTRTITITFKDRFRFSALPLNSEDRKAIKRLREIIV